MTIINKNALIPHSASEMYDLVLDVESYSQFLPWCSQSELLLQTDDFVEGKITVDHSVFKKSFVTRNKLLKNKKIEIKLLQGPFQSLEGIWEFTVLDSHCSKISLNLEFEFKNKIISMALGPVFSQIANSMVDSFCKRAAIIYKKND